MPVTEVALAAGFWQRAPFQRCAEGPLWPDALAMRSAADAPADQFVFDLGYRPPLAGRPCSGFAARVVEGVEAVDGGAYARTLAVSSGRRTHLGWLRVEHVPARSVLRVTLSGSLAHAIPQALGKVRRLRLAAGRTWSTATGRWPTTCSA